LARPRWRAFSTRASKTSFELTGGARFPTKKGGTSQTRASTSLEHCIVRDLIAGWSRPDSYRDRSTSAACLAPVGAHLQMRASKTSFELTGGALFPAKRVGQASMWASTSLSIAYFATSKPGGLDSARPPPLDHRRLPD